MNDKIDPNDPFSITIELAEANPKAYAHRFSMLPPEVQAAFLNSANTPALRKHFKAVDEHELKLIIEIAEDAWKVKLTPILELLPPADEGSMAVARARRMATELKMKVQTEVRITLDGDGEEAVEQLRRILPKARFSNISFNEQKPSWERGGQEPGEWRVVLSLHIPEINEKTSVLIEKGATDESTHAALTNLAKERAKRLAKSLRVSFAA